MLTRYLQRDRVRDQRAFEDAQRDYRDAAGRREAIAILPRAWAELIAAPEELLLDAVADKAEAMCGYKPDPNAVLAYLRTLKASGSPASVPVPSIPAPAPAPVPRTTPAPVTSIVSEVGSEPSLATSKQSPPAADRSVTFRLLGKEHRCANAGAALAEILRVLAARDPSKASALADAVRTRSLNHVAATAAEINPGRPDLVRAVEFTPGWLVGVGISNRDKMRIIRAAANVYRITMPDDLDIVMPNG